MIATLLLQKASGNASESGFKPVVWAVVVHAMGIATAEPLKKTLLQSKTCYHRVSVQYYIYVLLSTEYLQVSQLSSCVSFQLTTSYQSHHKAKKFMTKIFDDLAELC